MPAHINAEFEIPRPDHPGQYAYLLLDIGYHYTSGSDAVGGPAAEFVSATVVTADGLDPSPSEVRKLGYDWVNECLDQILLHERDRIG